MYLGQGLVLMAAYLIYALHSLNCLDNHNLKMTLYVSYLRKSLFQGIKKWFLNYNDHNDSIEV